MARTDDDSWDLSRGVGATATAVATSRALATRAGLIDDRWAEPLVKAVGMEHFLAILDGRTADDGTQRLMYGMAARTRYFDDFLLDCTTAGIRQVVILAAGLDARAYRLPWPNGTVVFDQDQAAVIDFKATTLAALAAQPTATVRNVGVDLRDDWPAALAALGFDSGVPTRYVPPTAIADAVRTRDRTCSRPGCGAPARGSGSAAPGWRDPVPAPGAGNIPSSTCPGARG